MLQGASIRSPVVLEGLMAQSAVLQARWLTDSTAEGRLKEGERQVEAYIHPVGAGTDGWGWTRDACACMLLKVGV